MHDTDLVK